MLYLYMYNISSNLSYLQFRNRQMHIMFYTQNTGNRQLTMLPSIMFYLQIYIFHSLVPTPIPRFSIFPGVSMLQACKIEKLGMGLGTRQYFHIPIIMHNTHNCNNIYNHIYTLYNIILSDVYCEISLIVKVLHRTRAENALDNAFIICQCTCT